MYVYITEKRSVLTEKMTKGQARDALEHPVWSIVLIEARSNCPVVVPEPGPQ